MDGDADRAAAEFESVLPRRICQPQRVGRCAYKDCGFAIEERTQPLLGRLAATGDDHCAHTLSRFEGCPEPDEWSERERDVDPVGLPNACARENLFPTAQPPVPTFFRVEPENRFARGTRCLMNAYVLLDRVRQIRPEGRVLRLVIHKLLLRRERKLRKRDAASKGGRVKPVPPGQDRAHLLESDHSAHTELILQDLTSDSLAPM